MPGTKKRLKRSKMVLYWFVGQKIKEIREENGLTQQEFADLLNVGRTSIVQIEAGEQRLPLDLIYDIAIQFNKSISDLLPEASSRMIESFEKAFVNFLSDYKETLPLRNYTKKEIDKFLEEDKLD